MTSPYGYSILAGMRARARYWAHPVWVSAAAVVDARVGIAAGGIRHQCGVLGTSHETVASA